MKENFHFGSKQLKTINRLVGSSISVVLMTSYYFTGVLPTPWFVLLQALKVFRSEILGRRSKISVTLMVIACRRKLVDSSQGSFTAGASFLSSYPPLMLYSRMTSLRRWRPLLTSSPASSRGLLAACWLFSSPKSGVSCCSFSSSSPIPYLSLALKRGN